tara:strand:- start:763 stop:1014 length:252 start_codon:yes stop_codon:yes gene_type:complete
MKRKAPALIEYRLQYQRSHDVIDSERFTLAEDDDHAVEMFVAMTTKGEKCRDWHDLHRWNRFSSVWEQVDLNKYREVIPTCED